MKKYWGREMLEKEVAAVVSRVIDEINAGRNEEDRIFVGDDELKNAVTIAVFTNQEWTEKIMLHILEEEEDMI